VHRGRSVLVQMELQTQIAAYEPGVRTSARDMEKHKAEYDSVLLTREFSRVRAFQITLASAPEILCAGALYPECDFDGKSIGNLANLDRTPELITFSLISTDTGGPLSSHGWRAVTGLAANWLRRWIGFKTAKCLRQSCDSF